MLWIYVHQVENYLLKPRTSLTCSNSNKIHPRAQCFILTTLLNSSNTIVKIFLLSQYCVELGGYRLSWNFPNRSSQHCIIQTIYFIEESKYFLLLEGSNSSIEIVGANMMIIWHWKWQLVATTNILWQAFNL